MVGLTPTCGTLYRYRRSFKFGQYLGKPLGDWDELRFLRQYYQGRNSVGQWQDGHRPSRPSSARVSLESDGTLIAHLKTQDIAKLAIKWYGLADAGSVAAFLSPPMHGRYGVLED
jgi:hypothetical protein